MTVCLDDAQPTTERYTEHDLASMIRKGQADPSVRQFHRLWYHAKHTWAMTRYKGVPILKAPEDLQVYHDILWTLKPHLVIETGTCFGGSAIWFADQVRPWQGRVVSVDCVNARQPQPQAMPSVTYEGLYDWDEVSDPLIEWVIGDSTSEDVLSICRDYAASVSGHVVVSLDADHHASHVAKELQAYSPLVTVGSYLVVEDTNMGGNPIDSDDPGPLAAVQAFKAEHSEFVANTLCERYLLTMHPGGWLCRVR